MQGLSLYWTIAVPQQQFEFESGQDIWQFRTVVCWVDSLFSFFWVGGDKERGISVHNKHIQTSHWKEQNQRTDDYVKSCGKWILFV